MNDEQEWVVKHIYSREEYQEDAEELRHGVPLDKFLYSRMRRALSNYFLREEIPPKSTHKWFYGGDCDLESGMCCLEVRYGYDPEQSWIIKRADIPENKVYLNDVKKEFASNPEHFDYVWNYVQEHFSIADIANLRNKAEQTLKLL